jgi:hypothetical protein
MTAGRIRDLSTWLAGAFVSGMLAIAWPSLVTFF